MLFLFNEGVPFDMEDIVARLFDLLESVACAGALTSDEEQILSEIEKDYNLAKEAIYTIKCPVCGKGISF